MSVCASGLHLCDLMQILSSRWVLFPHLQKRVAECQVREHRSQKLWEALYIYTGLLPLKDCNFVF